MSFDHEKRRQRMERLNRARKAIEDKAKLEAKTRRYSRGKDPVTSKLAAKSLDLKLNDKHKDIWILLNDFGPFTDDELSDIAVSRGLAGRHESARRMIRTLRDRGFIQAWIEPELQTQGMRTNASGRKAMLWESVYV